MRTSPSRRGRARRRQPALRRLAGNGLGSDGVAYSVTINKTGDVEAVKAMVTAILKVLAG